MLSRRSFLSAAAAAAAAPTVATPAEAATRDRAKRSKKGCCFVTRSDEWKDYVEKLRPGWMYSWGLNKPEDLPEGVEFCPMFWGGAKPEKFAKAVETLRGQHERGEIANVMGFNEPDQKKQSNMTVERVLELWPQLMEIGAPLVSPGCVHPDREWMHEFMEGVEKRHLRVDFVAVHSYGGPSADALMRRLEKVHKAFGRPLWITEFAVGDWNAKSVEEHRHPPKQVERFMKEVLVDLQRADFVDRYAWFSAGQSNRALGTSALFDDTGELTRLGRLYASRYAV